MGLFDDSRLQLIVKQGDFVIATVRVRRENRLTLKEFSRRCKVAFGKDVKIYGRMAR